MSASRCVRIAVVAAALALATACVMPDDISRLQKDVVDVQGQLRNVERTQEETEQRLDEMEGGATDPGETVTRAELADLQLRLEQVARQMAITGERISDLDQRLDRYSQDLQRSTGPTRYEAPPAGSGDPPPTGTSAPWPGGTPTQAPSASEGFPDPEALYNTAYADFSKGNYALAVGGFEEYQQRFPDSALADNALYWIAECHFSQGDYRAAVQSLDDLLARYPDSDKAAAANLKKAIAFQEQNQIGQAIIQFRYVLSAFPDTDEARLARDKLAGLGAAPTR